MKMEMEVECMVDDWATRELKNEWGSKCLTYQPQSLSESNPNEEKSSVEGDTPHPPMKQHSIT